MKTIHAQAGALLALLGTLLAGCPDDRARPSDSRRAIDGPRPEVLRWPDARASERERTWPDSRALEVRPKDARPFDLRPPDVAQPPDLRPLDAPTDSSCRLLSTHSVVAPGYAAAYQDSYSVPIGWGYMAPQVVATGSDVFTYTFYPCDVADRRIYCIQLYQGFIPLGPPTSLASLTPTGFAPDLAYQPPALSRSGSLLLMAYWAHSSAAGSSMVNLVALDAAGASPGWTALAGYTSPPGSMFNYLGGALGSGGEILMAGVLTQGSARELRLIRSRPPFSSWDPPTTVVAYGSPWFSPLYTHVVGRANGSIDLLTTIGHMQPCPETGKGYTSYKNVALFRGSYGGSFSAVWSNASSDVTSDPSEQGDPCYYQNSRFATDLLYNASEDASYAVVRRTEITSYDPTSKIASNASYDQTLLLYRESSLLSSDLGAHFAGPIGSSKRIWAISMTRVGGRTFLVAAAGSKVVVISTLDFVTFTAPVEVPAPYGAGLSVKLGQPSKNGSSGSGSAHLWFSGSPSATNDFLRFFHVECGT